MGNRGQIVIQDGNTPEVVLYTHWHGDDETLLGVLERALERGESRWVDASYLSRIIFCEMVKLDGNDPLDGLTGFGIQTVRAGDADTTIVVNVPWQRVEYAEMGSFAFDEIERAITSYF